MKMQICIERTGKKVIFMHFHAIIPDFLAVWNCGKLSAKFLVSSTNVIVTVGFFKVLLKQLLKFLSIITYNKLLIHQLHLFFLFSFILYMHMISPIYVPEIKLMFYVISFCVHRTVSNIISFLPFCPFPY